jgi:phage terminase small subunit
MRNPKQLTEIANKVNRRFFEAIETLVSIGDIKSLSGFCDEFDLSSSRYREMRSTYGTSKNQNAKESRYKSVEIEALNYLCNFYSVSAEWLLLGRGKMLKNEANDKI